MSKPLLGQKIAILVANGCMEDDVIAVQRAMLDAGANYRIVSPDNGLIGSWNGTEWGQHFAVDTVLGKALGADYDMLVIPAGQRSLDKLKLTAHSRRFISSFIQTGKPVAALGEALHMIIFTDQIKLRTVSGPATMRDIVDQAGGYWSDDTPCFDENLMTGACDTETRAGFVKAMTSFFVSRVPAIKAA